MWYRWTKVVRADIPDVQRRSFEEAGEAVIAHMAGSPIPPGAQSMGWVMVPSERTLACAWLREQALRRERRQDIAEAIEVAILVLVAVEALPIAISAIKHIF